MNKTNKVKVPTVPAPIAEIDRGHIAEVTIRHEHVGTFILMYTEHVESCQK